MKVSVIIPTYNFEEKIEKTINSVITQKADCEIELIFVDDCSTDRTFEICQKYGQVYRTKVNSGGPNKGRNIGLEAATGDVICLLDQDDWWFPDKLQKQLNEIVKAPIVFCGFATPTRAYNIKGIPTLYFENETFIHSLSKNSKDYHLPYMSTLMISKKLKHIRFEEKFGMLDWSYILSLCHNNPTIKVNEVLVQKPTAQLSKNFLYRYHDYHESLMICAQYKNEYPLQVKLAESQINLVFSKFLFEKFKDHFSKTDSGWIESRNILRMKIASKL
jgi:glycosyltransferase involved in cell wall biosynthesis